MTRVTYWRQFCSSRDLVFVIFCTICRSTHRLLLQGDFQNAKVRRLFFHLTPALSTNAINALPHIILRAFCLLFACIFLLNHNVFLRDLFPYVLGVEAAGRLLSLFFIFYFLFEIRKSCFFRPASKVCLVCCQRHFYPPVTPILVRTHMRFLVLCVIYIKIKKFILKGWCPNREYRVLPQNVSEWIFS